MVVSGIIEPKREGSVKPSSWLTTRPTSQPTNQSTNCNSIEQSLSWEANSFSLSQEIPTVLMEPELSIPCLQVQVTWGRRKFRSEELHDLYCSPDIFRATKSRTMIWAGNVACMDLNIKWAVEIYVENWRQAFYLEDPGIDQTIPLKQILVK